jgi:hypothetical protein
LPAKLAVFIRNNRKGGKSVMTKAQERSLQRLRQAIDLIQDLAPKELKRSSRRRKHDMENAHATLVCHAEKLQMQLPALSTYYAPQQYLDHARALERQLNVLEIPQAIDQHPLAWCVQPALGEAISYEGFCAVYNASREEIGGLVETIKRYRSDLPIPIASLSGLF